jgi:hypothetical protein
MASTCARRNDVYAVDAGTSLGRTRVEVDAGDEAPKVIQAQPDVGRITIQTLLDRCVRRWRVPQAGCSG